MHPYLEAIRHRVLLFDGAMGTEIQKRNLTAADYGGSELEGANDHLVLTRPDVIQSIHREYLEAGSDVIETNSFGSNRIKLEEYHMGEQVAAHNIAAASLARQVADEFSTPERPRFVFGSMGPTGMLPSSTDPELSKISFDELESIFYEQALALIEGGVDGLLIETSQDILEVKAVITGSDRAIAAAAKKGLIASEDDIVIQAQVTLDTTGRMLLGTDIKAALAILEAMPVDTIGLNCSTGPVEMREAVRYLCENSSKPVSAIPNAGMPENHDGHAVYPMQPPEMGKHIASFVHDFGLQITGGCCGTTPAHIAAMRKSLDADASLRPAKPRAHKLPMVASAMTAIPLIQQPAPALLGERLNAQGSKKMKDLLLADDFDSMVNLAREQEASGAHILDVCLAANERDDEAGSMARLSKLLSNSVSLPLMIDSTEPEVIEAGLKRIPGRPIVNSINLEGDGAKIHKILPLVKKYGAAVVALTIDEKGMADTVEWKAEVAHRIYDIAVSQYGLEPHDLLFDCLTFTLATGEEKYNRSAIATLEAIARVKKELPGVLTTLGLSNVSFGLAPHARKVLNSVFLYHAVHYGLDSAIVNAKEIVPYPQIPENERALAEDLIFYRQPEALQNFIAYFEGKKPEKAAKAETEQALNQMEPEKRIHYQIVNRIADNVESVLAEILKKRSPVSTINDVLLPAMKDVGEKFGSGELILPFVLQSAEVMKKSVAYVEQFLEASDSTSKGNIVLATVYGDVHDIGKNLVKTIWSNNGFNVIDLGKQVPVNTIIEQAIKHNALAIGLSALLVSTSKQMANCVEELGRRNLQFPVIVGGAAINRKYSWKISFSENSYYEPGVFYANDAFAGLDIANQLASGQRQQFQAENKKAALAFHEQPEKKTAGQEPVAAPASKLAPALHIPNPPFWGRKVMRQVDFDQVLALLDENYLFRFKWGVRSRGDEFKKQVDEIFRPRLHELIREVRAKNWVSLDLVYGYFRARAEGNSIFIVDEKDNLLETFAFPRQSQGDGLCLADYVASRSDNVALTAVTAGKIAAEVSHQLQESGQLEKSYLFAGLSTQLAEAMAEYIHRQIRKEWKIADNQGLRYSFGYPACPDLSDQRKLYNLLKPEEIGLGLTEGWQMDPEQSTSAMIFHHPGCSYFSI